MTPVRPVVSPGFLEIAVTAQAAIFLVGVSWAFGGNADWVRTPISVWGSLGILLTLAITVDSKARSAALPGTFSWMWPVIVLSVIVAISCLTPNFRGIAFGKDDLLIPLREDWWRPSSSKPETTLRSLWLFVGIYFSCLNIALVVAQRRLIRVVLAIALANAFALSVFGTVQKLVGSTGIFFGAVKSPQDYFFSSFVYDNHWGAFAILMLGAGAGLVLRYAHGIRSEGFFRGPAVTGIVVAMVIAISIPLSGSRACTLLLGILAAVAAVKVTPRLTRVASHSGGIAAVGLAAALLLGGIWYVAGDVIRARTSKTKEQVASMWAQGGIGTRSVLYRDTWRMARAHILFGWGMGSFPYVFPIYNTEESKIDRIPVVYHDAHSDWLQSVAEIGLVGTALVGTAVLLPVLAIRKAKITPVPFFLAVGALLIAAYAWVEFPFGNVAVVLSWWLCFFSAIQYVRLKDTSHVALASA